MSELMDIDSLVVDRPVRVGSSQLQADLERSIRKVGIRLPLVAREDGVVLDGVRRLTAAKQLGHTEVPVVVVKDFDTAILAMVETQRDGEHAAPADHYRAWYLHQATGPLLTRGRRRKAIIMTPEMLKVASARPRSHDATGFSMRALLGRAIGLSESKVASSLFLLSRVFDPNHVDHPFALRILENIDNNTHALTTAAMGVQALRRAAKTPSYEEQRSIYANSILTIPMVTMALTSIRDIDGRFTAEELDQYARVLYKVRSDLTRVIKNLKQKRGEK